MPLLRGAVAPDCAVWPVFCFPSGIPGLPLGFLVQGAFQVGGSRNQTMDGTNASQAVVGEVTWRFADTWSLTAGARYSRDKREFQRSDLQLWGRGAD